MQSEPSVVSIASVLRVRPFLFLWLSQIFSQIAFNMLNFVLVLRVYQLTASNAAVSALILFFMFPQLLLALFAGVLVDRIDKKIVMLVTNAARALCLFLPIFFGSNVAVLYITAFIMSIITQFFLPAEVPMIPTLVRKRLLLPANSLFTITLYGSIIVGYILAGPILKFAGIITTFLFLAILFTAASVCNSLLPGKNGRAYVREQVIKISAITYRRVWQVIFNDIGEMLYKIIRGGGIILALTYLTISQTVIVMLGALLPGYTKTMLSTDVEDSSLIILAPAAIGMIAGSFFVARVGSKIRKSRLVLPGSILSGVMLLLLPVFSRFNNSQTFLNLAPLLPFDLFHLVIAVCFLLGFFNAMIIIPANTVIQERSVQSIRGRIYGLFNALSALFSIIPVAIAGYFSDIFGVGKVLTFIGASVIVFGALPFLRGKEDI